MELEHGGQMRRKVRSPSDFVRNVLTLMVGTALAQALPIAISPILTRLYTPEDFGVLALFLAITTVIGTVANGRYELAIMLPKSEEDALNLAALGLCLATAISAFLLLLVAVLGAELATLLGEPKVHPWLFLTPIAVLFTGVFNSLNYYATRQKRYANVASANILKSVVAAATQITIGLVTQGASGLVVGQTASTGAANLRLARRSDLTKRSMRSLSFRRMRKLAIAYKDFPLYSSGAALANALASSSTSVLLARFYPLTSLGYYTLAQRTLEIPLTLIARSIGQVFFQEASVAKRDTGSARLVFRRTLFWLTLIMLPIAVALFFALPTLFALAFGEEWRRGGEMARILMPLFAARFVVVPLSLANQVNMKNRLGLTGNLLLLGLTVASILTSQAYSLSIDGTLLVMGLTQTLYYIGFLVAIYRHVAAEE